MFERVVWFVEENKYWAKAYKVWRIQTKKENVWTIKKTGQQTNTDVKLKRSHKKENKPRKKMFQYSEEEKLGNRQILWKAYNVLLGQVVKHDSSLLPETVGEGNSFF